MTYSAPIIIFANAVFFLAVNIFGAALLTTFVPRRMYDYNRYLFREKPFERKLYGFLRIKKWKDKLPVMDAKGEPLERKHLQYSQTAVSREYLETFAAQTCKAEIVHAGICVLGLASVLLVCLKIEPLSVFVPVYMLMLLVHLPFIFIQRYNRPRLLKLLRKKTRNHP